MIEAMLPLGAIALHDSAIERACFSSLFSFPGGGFQGMHQEIMAVSHINMYT